MRFLKNVRPHLRGCKLMNEYTEVLFEEMSGKGGHLGIITLNRSQVLNSLNHTMIHAMHAQLQQWANAKNIKAVVIRAAEGRAFCAGGDLRLTYDRVLMNDTAATHFFSDEYQLNRFIFHYPKPYIALLDGITMGGGVGISIHGSHRVATDRLLFAMPETGIGFFPDVGGTYFLPRLLGSIGYYLGLTGARISSDDCVAVGIAQHKVSRDALIELTKAIADCHFSTNPKQSVTEIIEKFSVAQINSDLIKEQTLIDDCFSLATMEDIVAALKVLPQSFAQKALMMLSKKSPTSLKVTLNALHSGAELDFDECMRQEFRLSNRFLQSHDFIEGIRAVIIDKDQSPTWSPAELNAVSNEMVMHYFSPMAQELACNR